MIGIARCARSTHPTASGSAGFTLLEALVALAVIAASLSAIAAVVATNIRGTRVLGQKLALIETARSVFAGMPGRAELAPGNIRGDTADHRWRMDVAPFTAVVVETRRPPPWTPQGVVLRVESPGGQIIRLDTVRLQRGAGAAK